MRNLPDESRAAQCLDSGPSDGETAFPSRQFSQPRGRGKPGTIKPKDQTPRVQQRDVGRRHLLGRCARYYFFGNHF